MMGTERELLRPARGLSEWGGDLRGQPRHRSALEVLDRPEHGREQRSGARGDLERGFARQGGLRLFTLDEDDSRDDEAT